jgi:hypothetical protein
MKQEKTSMFVEMEKCQTLDFAFSLILGLLVLAATPKKNVRVPDLPHTNRLAGQDRE